MTCSDFTEANSGVCSSCFAKINFIAEPNCQICGFPFQFKISEVMICAGCSIEKPKYKLARSLVKFDEQSKSMIHDFKYNDKTHYGKFFAKLMLGRYGREFEDSDIIVPVPMYKYKRLFRAYNPPQIIGHYIAKLTKKPLVNNSLVKIKWTKPQTKLNKEERQRNLKNSIKVQNDHLIFGKNIMLVDDVKTTGATIEYCAKELLKNGAKSVKILTIGAT